MRCPRGGPLWSSASFLLPHRNQNGDRPVPSSDSPQHRGVAVSGNFRARMRRVGLSTKQSGRGSKCHACTPIRTCTPHKREGIQIRIVAEAEIRNCTEDATRLPSDYQRKMLGGGVTGLNIETYKRHERQKCTWRERTSQERHVGTHVGK